MEARLDWKRSLAACLLAGACAAAPGVQAQQAGSDATVSPAASAKQAREVAGADPVRWYQEDANGAQRMRTRQKEIGAALDEAKRACRQGPASDRQACLKAARENWEKEMNLLRAEAPAQPAM
ncbi:hypothetical protein [Massilia sp. GCM10023247]|uniref:hypothetical protein n=1 Tax=Massilia sp. GCM10023247 TaxID=3252643 RepID=UPI0036239C00